MCGAELCDATEHLAIDQRSRNNVLRRLKLRYEARQKQMTVEVRRGTCEFPRHQLRSETNQPFASLWQACVTGSSQRPVAEPDKDAASCDLPVMQIDYCYTFTQSRYEAEEGEEQHGGEDQPMGEGRHPRRRKSSIKEMNAV